MKAAIPKQEPEEGRLTIGALSRATGIPIETLRTWERRYGVPEPMRKPSGHRVYALSAVPRLRRVAEAVARGHRPAEVVPISESALENLLTSVSTRPARELRPLREPRLSADTPDDLKDLMGPVAAYDGETLGRALEIRWLAQGPIPFLERSLTPFLHEIGRAWAAGSLSIRYEHFASARVADFLRARRRPYEEQAKGPRVALLTLPGDLHEIGLLMASLVFSMEGWQVIYLGPNTPIDQAASLSRDARLDAMAVSISSSYGAEAATAAIQSLRKVLPRALPLLAGGGGAPSGVGGRITAVADFTSLQAWARNRN